MNLKLTIIERSKLKKGDVILSGSNVIAITDAEKMGTIKGKSLDISMPTAQPQDPIIITSQFVALVGNTTPPKNYLYLSLAGIAALGSIIGIILYFTK